MTPITFVVAVNNREIYGSNFLASACFDEAHSHEIIAQEGFRSAARAYNDAIDKSAYDLMVFAHQDILLPGEWVHDLQRALDSLEESDPNWGVLGCYGVPLYGPGRGYVYSFGIMGKPLDRPAAVQTLDEFVLIIRKSKGLRFNERLPHFHFYGAEICMAAAKKGLKSYAISAFCIHNAAQYFLMPREFYESYAIMKQIWKESLPIRTTCTIITRFDGDVHQRRLRELYIRYVQKKEYGATRIARVADGRQLLREIESTKLLN